MPPTAQAPETLEISCRTCGATVLVEQHLKTAECPYCASHSVVERPPAPDRPEPVFVIPFVVERERARSRFERWLKSRGLFAHSGLKKALGVKVRGVYLPAYLYGAVAHTSYDVDIGENYTEVQTYTTTDSKGNTVVRTRTVTKTEWRDLSGQHAAYVLDVVVTASRGVTNEELESIEPFDLRALRRYTPAAISGWIAEEPTMTQKQCERHAHGESEQDIQKRLSNFMPGDSYRNLRLSVSLHDEITDLALLPVWVFAVRYAEEKPPVRIFMNGQTGKIWGKVPKSPLKIALFVIFLLAVIGLVMLVVVGAGVMA